MGSHWLCLAPLRRVPDDHHIVCDDTQQLSHLTRTRIARMEAVAKVAFEHAVHGFDLRALAVRFAFL